MNLIKSQKKQMYISYNNGYIFVHAADKDGSSYPHQQYMGYTKKEAIKKYREKFGLENKQFELKVIEYRPYNYGFLF